MIWLPALGALLVLVLGRNTGMSRSIAFIASLASLICAGVMVANFSPVLAGPQVDVVAELKRLVRGGPDIVLDSVGAAATIGQALDGVRPGGTAVIMGLHGVRQPAPINPATLIYQNKRLLGSFFGSAKPRVDLPMLLELYRAGRLPIDRLISAQYTLDELPRALADLEQGTLARGVILL